MQNQCGKNKNKPHKQEKKITSQLSFFFLQNSEQRDLSHDRVYRPKRKE